MVSTQQNHQDTCYHIQDICDHIIHSANKGETLIIGRLWQLFEIRETISQLTIPFQLQSHHYTALPLFLNMDDPNIINFALLPTEMQIITLLNVFAQQRTNLTTLLQNQGVDRRFLWSRIDHHQRELRERTPLDFATAVQVSPLANRRAPPPAARAARDEFRDVRR